MTQANRTEYVVEQAMQIILNAGNARTLATTALEKLAAAQFEQAEELLDQADAAQLVAHNIQTEMIQGDIRGGDEALGYHVLFAHAQDTLMTIQTELNMARRLVSLTRATDARLSKLEQAVGIERG